MGDNSKIFIGARSLTDDEVEKIVPTYNNIQNSIEKFRAVALEGNKENKNEFYHNNYNNTITILGKRGSGKTSVMLTLLESLKKDEKSSEYKNGKCKGNSNNYIVGFIKPDDLNHSTTIQGCIIDHFEAVKEKIIEQYKDWEKWNNKCLDDTVEKLRMSYKELLKSYIFTDPAYKDAIVNNYSDLNSYIDKSSFLLNSEANVEKKFMIFMNDLSNVHKKNNENIEPLFFIFFDDVDINTTKCRDIIDAILKYTSHPNIVVVVSGDYKTFLESLTHSMLIDEKINIINIDPFKEYPYFDGLMGDSENSNRSIYDVKRDLANDYLKKLFPPAYRNYVINWSLVQRANYSFGENKDKTLITMIYDKLGNFISDENNNNLSMFGYLEKNDVKVDNKYIIFERSFELFDNTSRGLVNAYYTLSCIIEEEMKNDKRPLCVVKNLIESIVHSNTELKDYADAIFSNMIVFGKEWNDSKIVLSSIVSEESLSDERIRFKLLLLCNFAMENFILDEKSKTEIRSKIFKMGLNRFFINDKYYLNTNREHINLWSEIDSSIKPFDNYNNCNLIYNKMSGYYNDKTNYIFNDYTEYNYSLIFSQNIINCLIELKENGFKLNIDNIYFNKLGFIEPLRNTRDNIITNAYAFKGINAKLFGYINEIYKKIRKYDEEAEHDEKSTQKHNDLNWVMKHYKSLAVEGAENKEVHEKDSLVLETSDLMEEFYSFIQLTKLSKDERMEKSILKNRLKSDEIKETNRYRRNSTKGLPISTEEKLIQNQKLIVDILLKNYVNVGRTMKDMIGNRETKAIEESHLVLFCYYGIFDYYNYRNKFDKYKMTREQFEMQALKFYS